MAQLVGASSHTPKFVDFIPGQGTCLDCSFNPQVHTESNQVMFLSHIAVSPSLLLPPSKVSRLEG